jgi:hypothetical protein
MELADTEMGQRLIHLEWPDLKGERSNIRKQARQVRYCVLQAREYFTAAQHVGTATRPNLLYYGLSSLAYAIILLRGGGEYSFDYMRSHGKGHHGLDLTGVPKAGASPDDAAAALRARPHLRRGVPAGTFADLVVFLRPEPVFVRQRVLHANAANREFALYGATAPPSRASLVADEYTFASLTSSLPDLLDAWRFTGHGFCLGTCVVNREYFAGSVQRTTTLIINGSNVDAQDQILSGIQFPSGPASILCTALEVQPFDQAMIIRYVDTAEWPTPSLTSAAHARDGSLKLFRGREIGTNWLPPLAAAYALLFQLSMLVRYHPDIWMRAVEERSIFSLLVEEVIDQLARDLPVLAAEQVFGEKVFRPSEASSLDWK